jgi:hypothetical protein
MHILNQSHNVLEVKQFAGRIRSEASSTALDFFVGANHSVRKDGVSLTFSSPQRFKEFVNAFSRAAEATGWKYDSPRPEPKDSKSWLLAATAKIETSKLRGVTTTLM